MPDSFFNPSPSHIKKAKEAGFFKHPVIISKDNFFNFGFIFVF